LWAFGVIGKAAILAMEKKYQDSADLIEPQYGDLEVIRDLDMSQLLDWTRRRNKSKLGEPDPAEYWDGINEWLPEPN
jgi:hypothetical protein